MASGAGYGSTATMYQETICLPDGDYELKMSDTYGDVRVPSKPSWLTTICDDCSRMDYCVAPISGYLLRIWPRLVQSHLHGWRDGIGH